MTHGGSCGVNFKLNTVVSLYFTRWDIVIIIFDGLDRNHVSPHNLRNVIYSIGMENTDFFTNQKSFIHVVVLIGSVSVRCYHHWKGIGEMLLRSENQQHVFLEK